MKGSPGFKWWRSKTIWGAVLAGATYLIQDPSPLNTAKVLGAVMVAAGARDALAKNGTGR